MVKFKKPRMQLQLLNMQFWSERKARGEVLDCPLSIRYFDPSRVCALCAEVMQWPLFWFEWSVLLSTELTIPHSF